MNGTLVFPVVPMALLLALGGARTAAVPLPQNDVAQAACDSACSAVESILNDRSNTFADLRAGAPDEMGDSDGTVQITIDGSTCRGRVVSNDSMTDNNGSDYRCIYDDVPNAEAVFGALRAGVQEAVPDSWHQWNDDSGSGRIWWDDAHTLIAVDQVGGMVKLWVYARPQVRANGFCSGS